MERDKNPIPEISLFPRLEKVGRALGFIARLRPSAPDFMSEHSRGAAAMLDAALYDEVRIDGFLYTGEDQLQLDFEAQADKGF